MTTEVQQPANAHIDLLMVYIGICAGKAKKRLQMWLPVTQEQFDSGKYLDYETAQVRAYDRLVSAVGRPGVVYSFKAEPPPSSIVFGSGTYEGQWPNDEQRRKWQIQHDALRDEMDLEAQRRKDGGRNLLYETLEPVAREYIALPATQRSLYLARVIEFITRNRTL